MGYKVGYRGIQNVRTKHNHILELDTNMYLQNNIYSKLEIVLKLNNRSNILNSASDPSHALSPS